MTASLKLHCTVLRGVRQANPTEDHRRQRTFAWAVAAVILTGSASLGQWIGTVVTKAQAASTWRRLWRLMNNTLLDVASYYEPYICQPSPQRFTLSVGQIFIGPGDEGMAGQGQCTGWQSATGVANNRPSAGLLSDAMREM